jgi:hypothetical protein
MAFRKAEVPTAAPSVTTTDKVFHALGFTAPERAQLRRGEIVSPGVKVLSGKELEINRAIGCPTR